MLLVKNAKIYTMADSVIDRGDILIKNGKIEKIGEDIEEAGVETINGEGLIALPGFVDCHSHIGMVSFAPHRSINDLNEMTNNLTPDVEAIYGVDVQAEDFRYAYESGITTVGLTPGSGNLVSGLVFAAKTYGENIFDMTIKNPIALKLALGGNPKGVYGKRNQAPYTRMSMPGIIKDLLRRGEKYIEEKENAENEEDMPKYDRELEVLIPVLKKEIPLKIHCTQFDMLAAIEIANEFDLEFTLEHAWGATDYMDEIVESGGAVVFGPLGSRKGFGESRLIDVESLIELDRRGTLTALTTDAPLIAIDSFIHHAGEVIREGGDLERTYRMLTINPAKIMGVDHIVGSIEEGKDGDLVLFKGIPAYDTNAKVAYTIVDGKVIYSLEENKN